MLNKSLMTEAPSLLACGHSPTAIFVYIRGETGAFMQTLSHCITFWTSGFSVDCVHHMIDEVLCVVDVVVAAGVGPVGCFTFRHEKDAPRGIS